MQGWSNTEANLLDQTTKHNHPWFQQYFSLPLSFQIKKKDIIYEIVFLPQWRPFWTVQWQKLYNVKIGPKIKFLVKNYAEKRYYKGINLNFFVSYNFSIVAYQAAILDFCKQNTNEALKLKKEDLKWVPRKKISEKEVLQRNLCMLQFFNGLWRPFWIFAKKKHVPLLGNFGTFYRSLRMPIWTTPEIFSFTLFFSIFTPENT